MRKFVIPLLVALMLTACGSNQTAETIMQKEVSITNQKITTAEELENSLFIFQESEEYQKMSPDKRKEILEEFLKQYEEKGIIMKGTLLYDETNNAFTYADNKGTLKHIDLE